MYRIGSLNSSNAWLYTSHRVSWKNDFINTLGIDICNNQHSRNMNFVSVIAKLKAIIKMWYYRSMTLIGKVTVVNLLMALLFVYKMQVLSIINSRQLAEIEELIESYIWSSKRPKISMNILKAKKEDGGLGCVDLHTKYEALMYGWIKDCAKFETIHNLALAALGPYVENGLLWEFNLNKKDSLDCFLGSGFWNQLTHNWHSYRHFDPQNAEKVKNLIIRRKCKISHL